LSVKFNTSDEVLLCCDSKPSRALNSAGIIPKSNPATGGTAEKRGIISNGVKISVPTKSFHSALEFKTKRSFSNLHTR
jgi:hypothetical protein